MKIATVTHEIAISNMTLIRNIKYVKYLILINGNTVEGTSGRANDDDVRHHYFL